MRGAREGHHSFLSSVDRAVRWTERIDRAPPRKSDPWGFRDDEIEQGLLELNRSPGSRERPECEQNLGQRQYQPEIQLILLSRRKDLYQTLAGGKCGVCASIAGSARGFPIDLPGRCTGHRRPGTASEIYSLFRRIGTAASRKEPTDLAPDHGYGTFAILRFRHRRQLGIGKVVTQVSG